jgi:hypothetical protein
MSSVASTGVALREVIGAEFTVHDSITDDVECGGQRGSCDRNDGLLGLK